MNRTWDEDRLARAGLCAATRAGGQELCGLLQKYEAAEIWRALLARGDQSPMSKRARQVDLAQLQAVTTEVGARFLVPTDPEWPGGLNDLNWIEPVGGLVGAPPGIWVRGSDEGALLSGRIVSMVGARACTSYGETTACDLSHDLADLGYLIVSGGAYGIDACAHRGALNANGQTVVVLASGVNTPYPRGNSRLFEQISRSGILLSEFPPDSVPTKPGFLARNRLIAALSIGTIVVEASARSGARNTATWASALRRQLMAVPGPITSSCSQTPNRLIRDGAAALVTSVDDIRALIEPVGTVPELPLSGPERELDHLDQIALAIRESLPGRGSRSADEIALACGLGLPSILAGLGRLEMVGLVAQDENGGWRLDRPGRT